MAAVVFCKEEARGQTARGQTAMWFDKSRKDKLPK